MIWTTEHEEAMRQRYAVDGPARLAKEWGTTQVSVVAKARRMGITKKRKQPLIKWTAEMVQMMKDRYAELGCKGLAKELGLSHKTMQNMASDMGLKSNAGHRDWGNRRVAANDSCNIHYFETWTANMAYTLGMIFADGTAHKSGYMLAIALNDRDKHVLDGIRKDMRLEREIVIRESQLDPRCKVVRPKAWLNVHSAYVVESLAVLHGLHPNKSHRDDPMPNVPEEFLPHFARGYIDGDGTVGRYMAAGKPRWSAGFAGQSKFVIGLQTRIFEATGIEPKNINKHSGCVSTQWQAGRWIERLAAWLYPSGEYIAMERKRDKFMAALIELSANRMFATEIEDRNNVVAAKPIDHDVIVHQANQMFATKI